MRPKKKKRKKILYKYYIVFFYIFFSDAPSPCVIYHTSKVKTILVRHKLANLHL